MIADLRSSSLIRPLFSTSKARTMAPSKIKTRLLILSDTHGMTPSPSTDDDDEQLSSSRPSHRRRGKPTGYRAPLPSADVALHCGDLTKRSSASEFRNTISTLRSLRAPLKLFIAGNHDCALDGAFYRENWRSGNEGAESDEIHRLIRDAEADGVHYLTEGSYSFALANGAALRLFASQFTPEYGYWAFQYPPSEHRFDIPPRTDIVMTHGPPLGVLDTTVRGDSAGCGTLLRAVASSRPKIHCFGHIHEAWGAYLAKWKPPSSTTTTTTTTAAAARTGFTPPIDASSSRIISSLEDIKPKDEEGHERLLKLSKQRGFRIDLTEGQDALTPGEQTLFVNAAIMDVRYYPTQLPWLIDVDLDSAD